LYKRILVAVDGSPAATEALEEALKIGKDGQALIRLLYVMDFRPMLLSGAPLYNYDEMLKSWQEEGDKVLREGADVVRVAGLKVEMATLQTNLERVSGVIVEDAKSWQADLVAVGTHGRHGLERMLLGSVAEGLARSSPIPVLLVRNPAS
jgi:nucleotide-binding universal stress UspA family protein